VRGNATSRARALRRRETDAERLLWRHLRNRHLGGWKFRRQHPIGRFFADFACAERRLVVEVDGGQHAEGADPDGRRTRALEGLGWTMLRYWDDEVLTQTDRVLEDIVLWLERAPHPDPLPARGEREPDHRQRR